MKKLIAMSAMAACIISCNSESSSSSATSSDSSTIDKKMNADSAAVSMPSSTMKPSLSEGAMTMKDAKMMIMKGGKWVLMDQVMTCTDGCKVSPSGEVVMKDGTKMRLTEGMTIDQDGMMMDDKGKMMPMDSHMMTKD